jgi:putative transposase
MPSKDTLRNGRPEIFNTDQNAQFPRAAFFPQAGSRMQGRGPWLNNVSVERQWRSLKYEEVI